MDLSRLRDEGYEVGTHGGYVVIRHVPYLNRRQEVRYGTLACGLSLSGDVTSKPNHVAYFDGEFPCHLDGTEIDQIRNQTERKQLAPGLEIQHTFSNKPPGGYADHHALLTRYAEIVSAPARTIDPNATATTFARVDEADENNPFTYADTHSSRAEIGALTAIFREMKVAIAGLGGTGGYVLDYVAKTPVEKIGLFDGDFFAQHNAFRAPGAASIEELRATPTKVEYFRAKYSHMKRNIVARPVFIDATTVDELALFDFVFVCIDRPTAKQIIFERLEAAGVPFIDVGMGVEAGGGAVRGILRVTASTPSMRTHVGKHVSLADAAQDDYRSNVQIAELNALNAAMAVVKWKKLVGFYADLEREHQSVFTIDVASLINDDHET